MRRARRTGTVIMFWLGLFVLALAVDGPVARWIDQYEPIGRQKPLGVRVLKAAGDFRYVAIAVAITAVVHRARWRAAAVLLLSCAFSGILYGSKWIFGRHRPSHRLEPFAFHPFIDGLPGIFYAKALGFPSGHACLSFAAASCLAVLFPHWRHAFYAVAIMLAVERVLEGAHYPSDVVAGAFLGLLSTYLALRLAERLFGAGWMQGTSEPEPPLCSQSS